VDTIKRPKLESQQASTNSTGTTSSSASHDNQRLSRNGSVSSTHRPKKDMQTTSQAGTTPHLSRALGAAKVTESSNLPSPGVLPGYRESIMYGANASNLSWREGPRDEANTPQRIPSLANLSEKRTSLLTNPRREPLPLIGSLPSIPSSQSSNPPPLMTHESTNSNSSSGFQQPRTPMESPGDRTLPPIYPPKLPGQYEISLPSIRPPSLSPQTSVAGQLQSPHGMLSSKSGILCALSCSVCRKKEALK